MKSSQVTFTAAASTEETVTYFIAAGFVYGGVGEYLLSVDEVI